jgi:hypothetical protein
MTTNRSRSSPVAAPKIDLETRRNSSMSKPSRRSVAGSRYPNSSVSSDTPTRSTPAWRIAATVPPSVSFGEYDAVSARSSTSSQPAGSELGAAVVGGVVVVVVATATSGVAVAHPPASTAVQINAVPIDTVRINAATT